MPPPRSFLITWTTYGTWLQGDERGSVLGSSDASTPYTHPDRGLALSGAKRLRHDPVTLNTEHRRTIERAIRDHSKHRDWTLHAIAVRTNHVHVVVSGDSTPERMLVQFKAWSTRRLRERGLIPPDHRVWTAHGSTRYLNTEPSLDGAIRYVRDGQGKPLG